MEARVRINDTPARLTTEHRDSASGEPVLIFLGRTLHPGDAVQVKDEFVAARDLPIRAAMPSDGARELISRFCGRPML